MKLCSEQLSLSSPEKTPDSEELDDVRKELSDLLEQVVVSDLDSHLSLFLVQSIHDLLNSIDLYRIAGTSAIADSISNVIGSAQIMMMSGTEIAESTEVADIGSKFWRTISRLADLVNIAAGSAALAAISLPALGMGHI